MFLTFPETGGMISMSPQPQTIMTARGKIVMAPPIIPNWLNPGGLRQDHERLRGEITEKKKEMAQLEALARQYGIDIATGEQVVHDLAGMTVRDAAVAVLTDEGVPLTNGDLYEKLVSRGVRIKGTGAAAKNNLYASILGESRIEKIGSGRGSKWGLKVWRKKAVVGDGDGKGEDGDGKEE